MPLEVDQYLRGTTAPAAQRERQCGDQDVGDARVVGARDVGEQCRSDVSDRLDGHRFRGGPRVDGGIDRARAISSAPGTVAARPAAQFVVERTARARSPCNSAQRRSEVPTAGRSAGSPARSAVAARGEVLDDDSPGHRIHHDDDGPTSSRRPGSPARRTQRGLQHDSGLGIEQVGDGLPSAATGGVEVAVDLGHEDRRLCP